MRKNFQIFIFITCLKNSKIQNKRKADMNTNKEKLGNARSIR